jgi:hypothetical protein
MESLTQERFYLNAYLTQAEAREFTENAVSNGNRLPIDKTVTGGSVTAGPFICHMHWQYENRIADKLKN